MRRGIYGAAALAVILSLTGCTYLGHRGRDALEMFDLGVTGSKKPCFALYVGVFAQLVAVGYGDVDGGFAGWGDGKMGAMDYHERAIGLILWGEEQLGFDEFHKDDPDCVRFQRTGFIGLAQGPFPQPDYFLARHIYVHLGWGGVVVSIRYWQILDFVLGWTTLDIAFDDGRPRGEWGGKRVIGIDSREDEHEP